LQRQQFDNEATERHRAQASRVFIWTEYGPDPRRTEEQLQKGVPWYEGLTAHVRNASEQPVYDVTVSWQKGTAPWGEPDQTPFLIQANRKTGRAFLTRLFLATWTFPFSGQLHGSAMPPG
jgi:hypothetical protein